MSARPLVTTIITCYNKAPWIEQCISSVLSQSIVDSEVLVVDDASTDGSVEIIKRLEAENGGRLRAVFHRGNKGISVTWREAVDAARGSYIARLDGDDWWIPDDKLEKQIALLESSEGESKWCNTDFSIFDKDDVLVSEACFENGAIPLPRSFEEILSTRGFTNPSTWLVDADFLKDATAYMRDEAADDSFEMQLYMFRKTRLVTVPEPLVANRMMQGSDSRPKNTEAAL
ncbi:MAG: glycosyltransferase family A protein, partial [Coriobacteriales bacterium]|nr:glycosyltransferase family A protein [Coriobacteriales bacterium]